ncbi:MAG: hypothetical protein DELT_02531 [Desulfovibrio sp.]
MSVRGEEWAAFSGLVAEHVDNYTVPQYGDAPHDAVSEFSEHDIAMNLRRYVNRMGTNQRGQADAQRDLLKIAHYCGILYFKREAEKDGGTA